MIPLSKASDKFPEIWPKCLRMAGWNNADNAKTASAILSLLGRLKLFHGIMTFKQYKASLALVTHRRSLIDKSF